jgi:hypothetical protein
MKQHPQSPLNLGRSRRTLTAIALVVGLLGSAGCQSQTGAKDPRSELGAGVAERSAQVKEEPAQRAGDTKQNVLPPPLPGMEQALRAQITQTIGTAACDAPAQCKTIGLGSTPCGGPEAWVAWSNKDPATARLPALAEQLAELQRSRHAVSGMRSICRYVPDPGATCTAGQCTLKTASTAI